MDRASIQFKVNLCSKCPGDKEYHCKTCPCDLCPNCKENHVKDLQTIDHDVVLHRNKINYILAQEICVRHPSHVYIKYCEPCELPVCFHCRKHRTHIQLDVNTAFQKKRQQHLGTIHAIRSETLLYRHALLTRTKSDIKTCHTQFSNFQPRLIMKFQKLKNRIDKVKKDLMYNMFCDLNLKHRCLKQKIYMTRHIVSLQGYEHNYEQSAFTFSALKFLSSIKTSLPQIHLALHTSKFYMTESYNKKDVMESLSKIKTTDREKRHLEKKCLLKLMPGVEFHRRFILPSGLDWLGYGMYVNSCLHMSIATPERVWVSDDECNLVLTDLEGEPLAQVKGTCSGSSCGKHTVNNESEMFYIDEDYNINKLSKDRKTTTTFIERTDSTWSPRCVYWSPSTGDLLVGMYRYITDYTVTGRVTRYNQTGKLIQTILHNNTGLDWCFWPNYITENINRDVVVSANDDCGSGAVVVTDRGGKHRFSYTGHPSGSGLDPCGICTDALSHILVCDDRTHTIQMLDRDGQFLSHLLIRPSGIFSPQSLSYDVNTHRLWVGSSCNKSVVVYRYIDRHDPLTGK
ncbi:uncharacterized protein LOC128172221 [Crassostrea angulata]|uniref:uncharacterized protein LOC128172221 n=1 Tax=Magallana angulata TaxID=2784310 RepID=UPI0022B13167|nr:uncharacterized protein LOC128172221 [Crassostrea angulata]